MMVSSTTKYPYVPSNSNYSNFIKEFTTELKKLKIKGLSFMVYGGFSQDNIIPGWSDIDGLLVFSDDLVINKVNLLNCGRAFAKAQKNNNVPTEISVCDLTTMRNGLLSPVDITFKKYLPSNNVKILLGPDYRKQFTYRLEILSNQNRIAWNLKKIRENFMFSEFNYKYSYQKYFNDFKNAILWLSKAPLKFSLMVFNDEPTNWKTGISVFKKRFPNFDSTVLDKAANIRSKNLGRFHKEYWGMGNYSKVMKLWEQIVDTYEELARDHLKRLKIRLHAL